MGTKEKEKDRPDYAAIRKDLEAKLLEEIPITEAMGITTSDYDGKNLSLQMPIEPNINHKLTAFGGSITTLTTLAGWGLIYLILKEEEEYNHHIVIQDSKTEYIRPVTDDFRAVCSKPSDEEIQDFITMFKEKGKARIKLHAYIFEGENASVKFTGRYVVIRR